ncbi:MAG TPA: acyl-CoA dehydrogenase family protein [Jatrophihabitantaceae bacterium]|jgi:acyl-CoA dehydrogenase|nr:acyl-CoA dehydrogenase family protein [Jatrophihabitantaceae bacterium]
MAADGLELLAETAQQIFTAQAGQSGRGGLAAAQAMWQQVVAHGMGRVSVPEPYGDGGELAYLTTLLRASGQAAVSVPLLQTHVGASALAGAGCEVPDGALTVAFRETFSDGLDAVPPARTVPVIEAAFAGVAETLVLLGRDGDQVRVDAWPATELPWQLGENLAGEPVGVLVPADLDRPSQQGYLDVASARRLRLTAILGRTEQLVGAGQRALEQTLTYVSQREQFGRVLARFQAVQHSVAIMASLVTASAVACAAAGNALSDDDASATQVAFDVLACRSQADRMAAYVVRQAHQLHGAIGFTEEHSLRFVTTRLNAWRATAPAEAEINEILGRLAFAAGDAWTLVAETA